MFLKINMFILKQVHSRKVVFVKEDMSTGSNIIILWMYIWNKL